MDAAVPEQERKICGIVMPISAIDNCSEVHWAEVQDILTEAIESAGFEANLVSNAEDIGIIQKRIIQNLYDNPIVVCDVSGKNPNVMFELGMRLAFDKPTIIVKDDNTSYSFDTSPIEHLEYPRDLRFSKIVEFKAKLAEKIRGTVDKANSDSSYTTFLKHFGEFTVAKIDKKEVSSERFMIEEIRSLKEIVLSSNRRYRNEELFLSGPEEHDINICMGGKSDRDIKRAIAQASDYPNVKSVKLLELDKGHKHLVVDMKDGGSSELVEELSKILGGRPAPSKHRSPSKQEMK